MSFKPSKSSFESHAYQEHIKSAPYKINHHYFKNQQNEPTSFLLTKFNAKSPQVYKQKNFSFCLFGN